MIRHFIVPLVSTIREDGKRARKLDLPDELWKGYEVVIEGETVAVNPLKAFFDYGNEDIAIVRLNISQSEADKLAARADVFAFPADSKEAMDITDLTTFLESQKIPADVIAGITKADDVFTRLVSLFFSRQRLEGRAIEPFTDLDAKLNQLASAEQIKIAGSMVDAKINPFEIDNTVETVRGAMTKLTIENEKLIKNADDVKPAVEDVKETQILESRASLVPVVPGQELQV